jgi:hypothetical protein
MVGNQKRDAVQQNDLRRASFPTKGLRNVSWGFQRLPGGRSLGAVFLHPLLHLLVFGLRRGNVKNALSAQFFRALLRKSALAAARAAQD